MTPQQPWQPPRLVTDHAIASITARQADVLTGICHGLTNAAIGRRLYVTEETVKTHVKRLLRALGARDRAHAASLVISRQVVVYIRSTDDSPRRAA